MNFIDRESLGEKLASSVQSRKHKDPIIISLTESSLMTSLVVARMLRGWVFPLIYALVYSDKSKQHIVGAYDQNCKFYEFETDHPIKIPDKAKTNHKSEDDKIDKRQQSARESIKKQLANFQLKLSKDKLTGRDLYIVGDAIDSAVPIELTLLLLKDMVPKSVSFLIGNTTPDIAQLIHVYGKDNVILDISNDSMSDGSEYFDNPDGYSKIEQYSITKNISTFWK